MQTKDPEQPTRVLSFPEIFAYLYNRSHPIGMGVLNPQSNRNIDNYQEAMQVYFNACEPSDGWCDYVRGRPVKTSFSPSNLKILRQNKDIQKNAPQLPGGEHIQSPEHLDPCQFFDLLDRETTSESLYKEMERQIQACAIFRENEKNAADKAAQGKWSPPWSYLSRCTVYYTLKEMNSVNTFRRFDVPYQEAFDHLSGLSADSGPGGSTYVDDFKVCHALKIWPSLRVCERARGSIKLDSAVAALKSIYASE